MKRFDVYGYVDYIDLMMDAADCVVTKPGGITSSEALAKGLPMIMTNPIPGHEMRNAEFMLNNGIALYATKSFPLDEAIFSLFRHPDRIEDIRATIDIYGRRNSTENLCDFLMGKVNENEEYL
jgi:processive 1,2-diacylglycerol beta-glucosyltransferase